MAGDPSGLAAAYDQYAPQLLAYCRSLLREPADAADAVQDTFVIAASRLKDLRDPDRLRSWLYTVARNSCLRKLRAEKVASASYPAAPGVAGSDTDVGVRAELADLRALVRDASAGLVARDREILVLRLWQGMDAGEAAAVLGVSRSYASALFARARAQLEVCVGVLLVARTGQKECARLATLLQDWDGHLNVLLRKRLSRHIDHCATCSERRRQELVPALLGLSAGAAIAGAAAADAARQAARVPAALKGQVLTAATGHLAPAAQAGAGLAAAEVAAAEVPDAAHSGPSGAREDIAGSAAGPFGKDGFPEPERTGTGRVTRAQATAAAGGVAAAAVIATAVALALSGGSQPGRLASGATGESPGIPGAAGATTPAASVPGRHGSAPVPHPRGNGGASSAPGQGAGAAGTPSALPTVGVLGGASPQPTAGSPGTAPAPGSSSSSAPPSSPPPPATTPASTAPAPGTLSVSTTSIPLDLGGSGTLTLTANGGPVAWSISVPSTLLGDLSVSPSSGTLAAGHAITVKISVIGLASLDTTLEIEPGNIAVTVAVGLGL